MLYLLFLLAAARSVCAFFETAQGEYRPFGPGYNYGAYPQDFNVVGPPLEAVHDSQEAPTGLAVDEAHNIYLTYPRNSGE